MPQIHVRYIGPHDAVEVGRHVVQQGEMIAVPPSLAGRPPDPRVAEIHAALAEIVDLKEYRTVVKQMTSELANLDHGEGLLAQVENWAPSTANPSSALSGGSTPPDSRESNGEATAGSGEPPVAGSETGGQS